jgi:hypothetical protein
MHWPPELPWLLLLPGPAVLLGVGSLPPFAGPARRVFELPALVSRPSDALLLLFGVPLAASPLVLSLLFGVCPLLFVGLRLVRLSLSHV